MKNTIKLALTGAAIAATAAAGLGLSGTANATTGDAAFLTILAEQGIYATGGPDYEMIKTAHLVCNDLTNGVSWRVEAHQLSAMTAARGAYLSSGDAAYFVGASEAAYCPWVIGNDEGMRLS